VGTLHRITLLAVVILCALMIPRPVAAQDAPVTIELAAGTDAEAATRDAVLRLLSEHDIERWLFTRRILIDETQIPHSHPVLTLHTRHLGDDLHLMSTLIHEQYHWFVSDRDDMEESAVERFREIWPDAPGREGQGARDQYSTYLHLIVCDMEFQGMTELYGEETARKVLTEITHYEWIYDKVLNDPRVREVNAEIGFLVPGAAR